MPVSQMSANPYESPREGSAQANSYPVLQGEYAVIWTLWLTYGAFYFCRTNISAAVPGLKASPGSGGLGLSAEEVGWILASLKIAYGVGQFFNGQLSERFSPRAMLAIGMFGSAALNVLFGLSSGFYFLLFVWATNGFCQSLGWTPCVRVPANWIPIVRRGHAIGIIGTGYQLRLGMTDLVAGFAAHEFVWRVALYVHVALLAMARMFMLACVRETPLPLGEGGSPSGEPGGGLQVASRPEPRHQLADVLFWTLTIP